MHSDRGPSPIAPVEIPWSPCNTLPLMAIEVTGYALLDSGDGRKLEQFGSRVVSRPSSLSTWRCRLAGSRWEDADASYSPPDRWELSGRSFSTWSASIGGVNLELELMSNGQVGVFPEHALYLPHIREAIDRIGHHGERPVKVLNLFAYTGLATCFCASLPNVTVTHVDLAKRAIDWAKKNAALNNLSDAKIRWIVDDALAFMAREQRKGSSYDIVIIDPPSFSRVSKNNSWTLEDKAPELVRLTLAVLAPSMGAVFFTNHSTASTSDVVRNIALDMYQDRGVEISIASLSLQEQDSPRRLPAGSLITLFHRGEP